MSVLEKNERKFSSEFTIFFMIYSNHFTSCNEQKHSSVQLILLSNSLVIRVESGLTMWIPC